MPIFVGNTPVSSVFGTSLPFQKVLIGAGNTPSWVNQKVIELSNSTNVILKDLFSEDEWTNQYLKKKVVIPNGITIGATVNSHAIAIKSSGNNFAGELILENNGTISGIGGTINGGVGGSAIHANFPGSTENLIVNNYGTIRAGGGGGGLGGNGGGGYYQTPYTYREPSSGWYLASGGLYEMRYSFGSGQMVAMWGGSYLPGVNGEVTSYDYGGWTYLRGPLYSEGGASRIYNAARQQTRYNNNYTSGGIAGNAGRGQGFDGAAATGAAAVAGGTNAGASGKSGDGGAYGVTGQTGANGASGNNGAGTAGAVGGLAGYYLYGGYATLNNFGTVQGRVA